jgi:hypothetical protein
VQKCQNAKHPIERFQKVYGKFWPNYLHFPLSFLAITTRGNDGVLYSGNIRALFLALIYCCSGERNLTGSNISP